MFAALAPTSPAATLLHLPCVATTAIAPTWRLAGFDHVVFTSPKGVRHAMSTPRLRALVTALPSHAFGQETARAMTAAGLKPRLHPVKSSEALAGALIATLPKGARVALPGPEAPAFDLEAALNAAGHQAEAIVCYKSSPCLTDGRGHPLSAAQLDDYAATLAGAVCFLSPSAVTGFVSGFGPRLKGLSPRLTAVVIGATTASAAVPHFGQVLTAPDQSATAVVAMAHAVVSHLMQASSQA
jgi:uroporphyrinogen-III synthase